MTSEPDAATRELPGGHHTGVDIAERRLHPAYLLISFGRSIRALIPVIAVGIWKAPGWAIGLLAGLVLLRSFAEWWMRKYSVVDGSLRVRSGLFKRTQDTIATRKITALEAERGVVQRLFGVWGLKVQTPGHDHRSAVRLACLSAPALAQLRAALRLPDDVATASMPGADPSGSGEITGPVTLAVLGTRTLLVAAVTGTSIPLIMAGAAATFGRAHDLLPQREFDRLTHEVFVGGPTTLLLLFGAVVLAVLAGIALTSLRLARFTLVRDGDRLRISRGLIAQRLGSIAVERVQAVRIVEGSWRRLLGYCALEVEAAGLSTSSDTDRMLFPLIKTDRVAELVASALPELGWRPALLTPVPAGARRRYFTLPVLFGAALTAGLVLLPGWGAYLALLPLPLALLVGWGQAVDAAWGIDGTTVTLRWRRVLARHTVIARRRRVQLTEVSRTPFQRRAGLSGIRLRLSARRYARLRHLAAPDASMLLHTVGRRRPSTTAASLPAPDPATYRGR